MTGGPGGVSLTIHEPDILRRRVECGSALSLKKEQPDRTKTDPQSGKIGSHEEKVMAAVDDSSGAQPAPTQPPAAKPEADEKPPAMPDQQPRWADPIFRAGLAVGSGLFLIGILCQTFNLIAPTVSILVICSGLGIIFGAFGSTAVINYKGIVIAGVAAIAVALLLVVDWVMRESLVRLEVDGDVKGARLELFGDEAYPGADHGGRRFEFFIIGREITKDRLSLIVTLPTAEMERSGRSGAREISFDCIPSTAITRFIGGGKTLQWRFDADREVLVGVDGGTIKSGPCFEDEDTPSFASLGLVGAAMAQDDANIDALLADLESESAAVRREARIELAALGEAAIVPMMNYWQRRPDSYPVRLGVSTALTEFMRSHKGDRHDIAALLTDSHLTLLAAAAGDPDRNLRIYASEFLYDLGDKRVVPIAETLFPAASDDGRYNLVVVIQGAVPDLGAEERRALAETLRTWQGMVGPNTQKLIATVVEDLAT